MIQEKLEDIKIQYWYSQDFKWLDPMKSEIYQGHPRAGGVYRAIVNESTGNTKLLVNPTTLIVLNDFIKGDDYEGNVVHLTKENILDLNLPETELDKILNWKDNGDLKSMYAPQLPMPIQSLQNAIRIQQEQDVKEINLATNILAELRLVDQLGFEVLMKLADIMVDGDNSPVAEFALDKRLSTGINMQRVMKHVLTYIGDDRRTNLNREDLVQAFMGIINELKAIELDGE